MHKRQPSTIMRLAAMAAAAALTISSTPGSIPASAAANDSPRAIALQEQIPQTLRAGDAVFLGTPDEEIGYDGQWRVLDPQLTNTKEPGILLLLEHLIGPDDETGLRFLNAATEADDVATFLAGGKDAASSEQTDSETLDTAYQHSDLKKWLENFADTHLSDAERAGILHITKSDDAYVHLQDMSVVLGEEAGKGMTGKVHFDPAENILDGDQLFPLSVEEIDSPEYGLDTDDARVATYKGEPAHWWARSPHAPDFPNDVGFIFWKGWMMDFPVNNARVANINACARPAMNLDAAAIAFICEKSWKEEAAEGKWTEIPALAETSAENATEWLVFWSDTSLDGIETVLEDRSGDLVTLTYSNAPVRENAWICAAVKDAAGNLTWYNRLKPADAAEGTLEIDLSGKIADGETLVLFCEENTSSTLSQAAGSFHTVDLTATPQAVLRAEEEARLAAEAAREAARRRNILVAGIAAVVLIAGTIVYLLKKKK